MSVSVRVYVIDGPGARVCVWKHIRTSIHAYIYGSLLSWRWRVHTWRSFPMACQRLSLSTFSSCPSPFARVTSRYLLMYLAVCPSSHA